MGDPEPDLRLLLQQAQERADVLFSRAPIGLMEGAPDGTITRVNDVLGELLGYDPSELVGRHASDLATPEEAAGIRDDVQLLRQGQHYTRERTYVTRDGRHLQVLVSSTVRRDPDGVVTGLTAFVVDLTVVAHQRAELERRQRFTETVLETVDVGIVTCDATGQGIMRNRAEREITGLARHGEIVGPLDVSEHVDVFDTRGRRLTAAEMPILQVLAGHDVGDVELRMGPRGGPHHDVVVRGRRIEGADGEVQGAVLAVADVTALRAAAAELAAERRQLQEAQRLGHLGSFTYDADTHRWTFSDEIFRIWGLPVQDEFVTTGVGAIHDEDRARSIAEWMELMRRGGVLQGTHRIVRGDGEVRHVRIDAEASLIDTGTVRRVHGTYLDITEINEAERRATEAKRLFEAILAASPDHTQITDVRTGAIVYGTQSKGVLGVEDDAGLPLAELVHPGDLALLEQATADSTSLADGEVAQVQLRARHVNGSWHWLSRRVTPFRRDPATGEVIEVLSVVRDVTDIVEAEQKMAHAALHDPLTSLPNRTLLTDRLEEALMRGRLTGREVALLFCDLDGFKGVNDLRGHATGDAVLMQVAGRIRDVVGAHDTIARVGGDEFVVLVQALDGRGEPADDRARAQRLANRLLHALRRPLHVDGIEHVVTASIGIAYADAAGVDSEASETLLQNADAAMYRAKHRGKDRVEVYEDSLRAEVVERGHLEQELRRAFRRPAATSPDLPQQRSLRQPTLSAMYQPVVHHGTGRTVGFEALARLHDSDGTLVMPDTFVPLCEERGLVRALGVSMLDLSCRQLAAWRRAQPDLAGVTVAVNVSAHHVQHPGFLADVRAALGRHGLDAHDLVLELTERTVLNAATSTIEMLEALRSAGVGIAIDDFGTGYASLRYLASLPISIVKIDKSFTSGLPHDPVCSKIVRAVVGLAQDLELTCVVEGVETATQLDALPADVLVQGWLTGRPAWSRDMTPSATRARH